MKKFLAVLVVLVGAAWLAVPAFATVDPGSGAYLEICKTSGSLTSGVFAFHISSDDALDNADANTALGRTIYVNVGECSPELYIGPESTEVTVTEVNNEQDDSGFWTNDYTDVTSIHTVAPGAPDQQLGEFNLAERWADITVNSGGPSQGTTVKFNNELVQGYYEICKNQVQGAGLAGQSFNFSVEGANGYSASLNVPVGGCSFPTYAPAGHVNIQEDKGTFTYVDTQLDPTDHTPGISSSTGDLLDSSIPGAWAVLGVDAAAPGDTAGESIVSFRNNSSLVKVCKVVPTESDLQNLVYQFNVDGVWYSVHSFSYWDPGHVYGCVLVAKSYRTGTSTTITEKPQPGQALDHIWLTPDNDTAVDGGNDFTGQSVTFNVQSGMNEVFFLNVPVDPQLLKICKTNGPKNGSVTYNVTGPTGTAPDITQGHLTLALPLDANGAGCAEAGMWSYIGPVTVVETIPTGSSVTAITANDSSQGNRLASSNLATGTAVVYIGEDTTIVSYTNGAAVAVAPATGGSDGSGGSSGGSGGSGGQSGATSSSGAAATASTASTSAPTKVTPAASAKVAATASVASVRIVTIKQGRYVFVRIVGTAKTARIHLTLIGANHQVLKTMTRYVATNKSARVGNLRLGTNVQVVRVAL
jgi:hypothetical protein